MPRVGYGAGKRDRGVYAEWNSRWETSCGIFVTDFDFARGAMRLEPLRQKQRSVENINPEVVTTP